MAIQSPQDLFVYTLYAIYEVEHKLADMLPVLAEECQSNAPIRDAFLEHRQETFGHIRNLDECFRMLGIQPVTIDNHAVVGLKQDHDTFLQQQPTHEALTMFDLQAGSQSEYLEMAIYTRLTDAATCLGFQQCVPLLQQNLQQEEAAANKLATFAHQLGQQTS